MSSKLIIENLIVFLWFCGGLIPARIAWDKGRGIILWWVVGLFLWPLLIPIAALVPPNEKALAARAESPDPEREWRQTSRWGVMLLAAMAVASTIHP